MTALENVAANAGSHRDSPTVPSSPPRLLLPIPETCTTLGVGRSTVYAMAGRGDIEIVRIGRRALVPMASIEAYVARLRAVRAADVTAQGGDGHGATAA